MIIACPSCETRFEVNAAAFPPAGRKVKCARCSHVWHATLSAAEPAVAAPVATAKARDEIEEAEAIAAIATPTVLPPQEDASPEKIWAGTDIPPRRSGRLATAALASACVVLVAAGLYIFRDTIVAYVPATAPAYAALGVPLAVKGLELEIAAESLGAPGDGATTLVVTGSIANITGREQSVPPIRATILSKDKAELHSWTFDAGIGSLKPGERHEFRQELAQPPADTYQVFARFADGA